MCKKPVFSRFSHLLRVCCIACVFSIFAVSNVFADVTILHWTANVDGGTVTGVARCGPKADSNKTTKKNWVSSNWSNQGSSSGAGCFCRQQDIESLVNVDSVSSTWADVNGTGITDNWYGSGTGGNSFTSTTNCYENCADHCATRFESSTDYQQSICGGDCPLDSGTTTEYTITYDNNGGSGCEDETYTTTSDPLCEPTRDGYTFDVWMDVDTLEEYAAGTQVSGTNLNLEAQWIQNATYSIIYYNELPDGATNCTTCSNVNNYTGQQTICTPSCEGYVFDGWMDDDTGDTFNENGTTSTVTNRNLTLYGIWSEIVTYTITYNNNGGSGCDNETYVTSVDLCTPTPPPYYTFDGWIGDDDNIYNLDGTTDTISGKNIVLTASYTLSSCDDGYYLENSTCKSCSTQTGGEYTLSDGTTAKSINACYKTWSCAATPSCPENSANCQYIGATSGTEYYGNSATHCLTSYDCATGYSLQSSNPLYSQDPSLDGDYYGFNNDSRGALGSDGVNTDMDHYNLSDQMWAAEFGYGTIRGNASCNTTPGNNNYNEWDNAASNWTADYNSMSRTDTGTQCWCQMTDFTSKPDGTVYTMSQMPWVYIFDAAIQTDQDCAYFCAYYCSAYAQDDYKFRTALFSLNRTGSCTLDNYTITLNTNDGSFPIGTVVPNSYTYESAQVNIPNPSRNGYTFAGWCDNEMLTQNCSDNKYIPTQSTGNKTFYASWAPVTYNITYNLNGASYDLNYHNATTYQTDSLYDFQISAPNERNGYEFNGWCDDADLEINCSVNKTIAAGDYGDKEFYASWTPITYTITYVSNGGTVYPNAYYTIESPQIILPQNLARTNFDFMGWWDNKYFNGESVDTLGPNAYGNKTFYAKWFADYDCSQDTNVYSPRTSLETVQGISNNTQYEYNGDWYYLLKGSSNSWNLLSASSANSSPEKYAQYEAELDYYTSDQGWSVTFDGATVSGYAVCAARGWGTIGAENNGVLTGTFVGCACSLDKQRWIGAGQLSTTTNNWAVNNENCRKNCPATCAEAIAKNTSNIRDLLFNGTCPVPSNIIRCDQGQFIYDDTCVYSCNDRLEFHGTCVTSCPDLTYEYNGTCVDSCPNGTYKDNGVCVNSCGNKLIYDDMCVDSCNDRFEYSGNCIISCPDNTVRYNQTCLDQCPNGTYTYNSVCMESCPEDTYSLGTNCVDSCGDKLIYGSMCVDDCDDRIEYEGMCYEQCPYGTYAKDGTCVSDCGEGMMGAESECIPSKFELETIVNPGTFKFSISAKGTYYIDWGDGSTETKTITSATMNQITHNFPSGTGNSFRIKISGQANEYSTGATDAAIRFGNLDNQSINSGDKITKIYGSLSDVFPTIGNGDTLSTQPRFYKTFMNCTNLFGEIPENLFASLTGKPVSYMFFGTFMGCGKLGSEYNSSLDEYIPTHSIPEYLFGDVSGKPGTHVFDGTFSQCAGLTGNIPSTLFENINGDLDGSEEAVFAGTFYMCSGLTGSIPEYLFSGVRSAPKKKMFNSTFYGCTNLSGELPQHLFDSISGDIVQDSFNKTFYNTPNLSGFVPVDFFKNITNSNNISDGMPEIFEGSGIDTLCPAGYQQHETIFDEYWSGHVSCEPCPSGQTSEPGGTCYIAEKTCYSGTYFNVELTPPDCDTCPENHYCPNGTWTIATADQSLNQCPQTYKHSPSGSHDEYACYANVTFVSNDGEEDIINHQQYSDSSPDSFSIDLPDLTRDNYTFVGWYDNEQLSGDIISNENNNNSFNSDATLYAKWGCPDGYTATIEGNITDSGTQCYTDCPADYYCPDGRIYYDNDESIKCPDGTFSAPNSTSNEDCIIPKFMLSVDTSKNSSVGFSISASGTFYIDWGDGTKEKKIHNNTSRADYIHSYSNQGIYTIKISGLATGYSTTQTKPLNSGWDTRDFVISFNHNTAIIGISGSLGAIFPTLNNGDTLATQPRFGPLFYECSNLTGQIPADLFKGVHGTPVRDMFLQTFYNTKLSGSIPRTLFCENPDNPSYEHCIYGAPAPQMFANTFTNNSNLTGSIPTNLFGYISGKPAKHMFYATFSGCSGLTGPIPDRLFGDMDSNEDPEDSMFYATFYGCSGLTGTNIDDPNNSGMKYAIPPNLFSGLSGKPAKNMFTQTFFGCSGLTGSIPGSLFSNISGQPADSMYANTFDGCSGLTGYIPEGLFGNISGDAQPRIFNRTFYGDSGLTGPIPENLFGNITGKAKEYMFNKTFFGCSGLTGHIPNKLFGTISGVSTATFYQTFKGATNLGKNSNGNATPIPADLFADVSGTVNSSNTMFYETFKDTQYLSSPVPTQLFRGVTGFLNNNADNEQEPRPYVAGGMAGIFENSNVSTSCDAGYYQYITGFEEDWSGHVACEQCPVDTFPNSTSGDNVSIKKCYTACPETDEHGGTLVETPDGHKYWTSDGVGDTSSCVYKYNITYVLNGADESLNESNPTEYQSNMTNPLSIDEPDEWDDITFNGWFTDSTFNTSISQIATDSRGDITLYAKWTSPDYTITFMDGETELDTPTPITYNVSDDTIDLTDKLPTPKANVKFSHWFDEDDNIVSEIPHGSTGNKTLYAQWGCMDGYTAIVDGNITDPSAQCRMECDATDEFGGEYVSGYIDGTGDTSNCVYKYTITYMDGETTLNELTNTYTREDYGDALPTTEKDNYVFNNWCVGTQTCETPINEIPDNWVGNKTLYAQWKRKITIHFDANANGDETKLIPEDKVCIEGEDCEDVYTIRWKSNGAPRRRGYDFNKYNTKPDVSGEDFIYTMTATWNTQTYTLDLSNVFNLTDGHEITLYAQWTPIDYTITYNLDGGTNYENAPISYNIETETITFGEPTKAGYAFDGWYENNEFTGDAVTQITKGSTDNRTLWAKWRLVNYTITYMDGENKISGLTPDGYNTTDETFDLPTTTKTGYTFDGWYGNSDLSGDAVTQIVSGSTENKTFWAKWTPIEYTITYMDGTDTMPGLMPYRYTIETETFDLPKPVKPHFEFVNWFDNAELSGEPVTQITTGSTENITLYAKWSPVQYSITYMDGENAISGLTPNGYNTTSETFNLPKPTKNGYSFVNWFDNAELTGEPITKIEKGSNEDKTFYAKWTMDYYTITFMDGDKVLSNPVPIAYTVKTPNFYLPDASKADYNFVKWVDSDGNMVNKIPRGSYGDKILYAQWTPKSFAIEYVLNGGKMYENAPTTYRHGIGATINVIPEKYSFEFVGWCSDEQLQNCSVPYIIPTTATTKQTLYAKWKYVCESGKLLHLGTDANDKICLYDKPLSHPSMAISIDNTTYYITLSTDQNKTINNKSAYKMHVEYLGTPYNAYDPLME